jgi:Protein of unknown function (DUF2934)
MQSVQESGPMRSSPTGAKRALLHTEIEQCARQLWVQQGKPAERDLAIWLEAEQLLSASATLDAGKQTSSPVLSVVPTAKSRGIGPKGIATKRQVV